MFFFFWLALKSGKVILSQKIFFKTEGLKEQSSFYKLLCSFK
ncbi:hypothetical protein LEP1GSC059_4371 [Leptospira noguchii serovar Panama str. CZ214]|uniref:Uncharacterized protein n=1 Tax=Leptospira noguchii serovar Panama str. CZ214 TaxID=1001595 RepID=T0GY16_9LEPT|nr:hypothetical protein LEP1GSC059_4371 [Leptospira noguchii serovar Panama str. CZ214]